MQTLLPFCSKKRPSVLAAEVETLVDYLLARGPVWTPAKELTIALGFNDRKLRLLKQSSQNRIISGPGCPGYISLQHCSLPQLNEVMARCRSQARAMTQEFIALKRIAHKIIG
jgi:hypothetical protein